MSVMWQLKVKHSASNHTLLICIIYLKSQNGKNLINGSEPVKLRNVSIIYEMTKTLLDLATIALTDELKCTSLSIEIKWK